VFEGDNLIPLAMNDEHRALDVLDAINVRKSIADHRKAKIHYDPIDRSEGRM
jgi:hypothetical protein